MNDSMSDITPNLSTALDVQLEPNEVYIKEQVNDIFIGDYFYNKRKFLRGVAISWVSLNIVILTSVFVFQYQRDYLKDLYRNWIQPNGYTYFFGALAFVCILIPAIFIWIARKLRLALMVLLLISFAYLSSYFLTYTGGVRRNGDEILLTIFMEINAGSFAFFINTLLTRTRYHTERGIYISLVFSIIFLLINTMVMKIHDPQLWVQALYASLGFLFGSYLIIDAKFMVYQRKEYYLIGDWYLGTVHLFTDIFFIFWRDLFKKELSQEQQIKIDFENDLPQQNQQKNTNQNIIIKSFANFLIINMIQFQQINQNLIKMFQYQNQNLNLQYGLLYFISFILPLIFTFFLNFLIIFLKYIINIFNSTHQNNIYFLLIYRKDYKRIILNINNKHLNRFNFILIHFFQIHQY